MAKGFDVIHFTSVFSFIVRIKFVYSEFIIGSFCLNVVLEAMKDLLLVLVPAQFSACFTESTRKSNAAVFFERVFVLENFDKLLRLLKGQKRLSFKGKRDFFKKSGPTCNHSWMLWILTLKKTHAFLKRRSKRALDLKREMFALKKSLTQIYVNSDGAPETRNVYLTNQSTFLKF